MHICATHTGVDLAGEISDTWPGLAPFEDMITLAVANLDSFNSNVIMIGTHIYAPIILSDLPNGRIQHQWPTLLIAVSHRSGVLGACGGDGHLVWCGWPACGLIGIAVYMPMPLGGGVLLNSA